MSNRTYGLKSFLFLTVSCVIIMIIIALLACLCAAFLVYLKKGVFIFTWHGDILFSIRSGAGTGAIVGIGIWLLSRMENNKTSGS